MEEAVLGFKAFERSQVLYKIVDTSNFTHDQIEPLGTKSKYWCSDSGGNEYLFKSIETYDSNNVLISRGGEDWSEKISCELARALFIPSAFYELAHDGKSRGVITQNFVEGNNAYLVTANEVLNNYSAPPALEGGIRAERQNIMHVYIILRRIIRNKPVGFNSLPDIKSASDFFAGYLMLDALISNQDRHSENWGLIVTGKGRLHLAPTFDHGAGLGRNESDETKALRLASLDKGQRVPNYVRRAKSYFYLRDQRLRTLKAFQYFGVLNPIASLSWLGQLELLTASKMKDIIWQVPTEIMSDVSKKFAFEILVANKSNIMDLKSFFEKNLDPVFRKRQIGEYE